MAEQDIKRNFEFLYYGRDRHISPDYGILDKPLNTLKELGGVERVVVQEEEWDKLTNGQRGASFDFRLIAFQGHAIKAYFTREERPDHPENPRYLTRIRLANYELTDEFTNLVSRILTDIPRSD